ncbi:hypothetical protein MC885_015312, partial [Smutsia gigantea]
SNLPDAKSRALDNIGRVFARVGKFQKAIDTWEEKIPLAKSTLEKTWLFHEIGRCYLELGQAWQAQNYGEKSQQCAEEEGDIEWQLNASVLVAQAQVKLRDFESAVNTFGKALKRAKLLHDKQAQQAIISILIIHQMQDNCRYVWTALEDANKCIIEELTNYREMVREKKEKEEAAELNTTTVMAKEKETRRVRDEPEKVVKQWEREQTESEKETEDELSKESLSIRTSRQEKRPRGIENSSLLVGPRLGTEEVAKRLYGEVGIRSGEEGSRPSEVSRQESREIYRRPSELDQKVSEELSRKESEELEKRLSETSRRELEELEKTELGEVGKTETTENAGTMGKNEKEDN